MKLSTETNRPERVYRVGVAQEYIETCLSRGCVAFALEDFLRQSGLSPVAGQRQLQRLGPWIHKLPRKAFYLIVSPEHRVMGAPPAAWWLDDYFRWLKHPYYLALQSAAAAYGSEPQAVQVVQVMSGCPRENLDFGRVRVRFFVKRGILSTPTQMLSQARAPLKVSTPAATVVDLVRYASRLGGLQRIWETTGPLLAQIAPRELRRALDAEDEPAIGQRLGFLLERSAEERLAAVAASWLPSTAPWTLLEPSVRTRVGQRIPRWRLVQNSGL
jgi:hypothetical protein